MPSPLSDRVLAVTSSSYQGEDMSFAYTETTDDALEAVPFEVKSGRVLCFIKIGGYFIEKVEENIQKITYVFAGNLGGSIPSRILRIQIDAEMNRVCDLFEKNFDSVLACPKRCPGHFAGITR